MSPAPALVFALALLAAAATPAQPAPPRPERPLPTHDRPNPDAKVTASGGGEGGGAARARRVRQPEDNGSSLGSALGAVAAPALGLLRTQVAVGAEVLRQLGSPAAASALLALFSTSAGASSGGSDRPAPTPEELQDLAADR